MLFRSNVSLGETQIPVDGRWPIDFQVDVDPSQLRQNHRYAIDAKIVQRGATVLEMNSPAPINLAPGGYKNQRTNITLVPARNTLPPTVPPNFANRPIDQVAAWYEQVIGRPMNDRESVVWQRELSKGKSLDEIYATILSSSEYFDRFRGNVDAYTTSLYRTLFGRSPTPAELVSFRNRLSQSAELRIPVVLNLVRQRTR